MKEKFELEYLLKTSSKVLEGKIANVNGLSEWFADNVTVKDDLYCFVWDGEEEYAKLLFHKSNQRIRFQWVKDEEEGLDTYFEIAHSLDSMTQLVSFSITDFCYPEDKESSLLMWEQQITDLRRLIGA